MVLAVTPRLRYPVFQEDAGHALSRNPVANLRSLEIHGHSGVSTARQHQDRRARLLPLGRVDRHGWTGDIGGPSPRPSRNELGALADLLGLLRLGSLNGEPLGP